MVFSGLGLEFSGDTYLLSNAVDTALAPVMTDRLANCQDMRLVKGIVEGRPTMTRGAERNSLRRDCRVRFAGEIRCH